MIHSLYDYQKKSKAIKLRKQEKIIVRMKYILRIVFVLTLIYHLQLLYNTYSIYPTSTKIIMNENIKGNVIATVCPVFGYSLSGMIEYGMKPVNELCSLGEYGYNPSANRPVNCWISRLSEMWSKSWPTVEDDVLLNDLWTDTSIDANSLFTADSFGNATKWNRVMTTFKTCYNREMSFDALHKSHAMSLTKLKDSYNCFELITNASCSFTNFGNLGQVLVYITPSEEGIPLDVSESLLNTFVIKPGEICGYKYPCVTDILLRAQYRSMVSTPTSPCISRKGYSQMRCLEQCRFSGLATRLGCSPPFDDVDNSLPQCTVEHYRNSSNTIPGSSDSNLDCEQKCTRNCHRTFLSVDQRHESNIMQVSGACMNFFFIIKY